MIWPQRGIDCTVTQLSWSSVCQKCVDQKEVLCCTPIIVEPLQPEMIWPKRGTVLHRFYRRAPSFINGLAKNRYCNLPLLSWKPTIQKRFDQNEVLYCTPIIVEPSQSEMIWPKRGTGLIPLYSWSLRQSEMS